MQDKIFQFLAFEELFLKWELQQTTDHNSENTNPKRHTKINIALMSMIDSKLHLIALKLKHLLN